jgi:hypothetical protein
LSLARGKPVSSVTGSSAPEIVAQSRAASIRHAFAIEGCRPQGHHRRRIMSHIASPNATQSNRRAKLFALILGSAVFCATTALTAAWDAADARGRGHASVGRASGGFFGGRSGPGRASIRPFRAGGHHARTGYRTSLRPARSFRHHASGGIRRGVKAGARAAERPRASMRQVRISGDEREKQLQRLRLIEADRARRETSIRRQQQEDQRRLERFQEVDRRNQKLFD